MGIRKILQKKIFCKNFFSSLNMYQAKSGVKFFFLYWGGMVPLWKFFFQSEHVSSQIWCQNFFPLLGGGGPSVKNFFPVWTCIKPNLVSKFFSFTGGGVPLWKFFFQSEHVSSQIWCQNFFPLLGGGCPSVKIFFPVWTCIKPDGTTQNLPFYTMCLSSLFKEL